MKSARTIQRCSARSSLEAFYIESGSTGRRGQGALRADASLREARARHCGRGSPASGLRPFAGTHLLPPPCSSGKPKTVFPAARGGFPRPQCRVAAVGEKADPAKRAALRCAAGVWRLRGWPPAHAAQAKVFDTRQARPGTRFLFFGIFEHCLCAGAGGRCAGRRASSVAQREAGKLACGTGPHPPRPGIAGGGSPHSRGGPSGPPQGLWGGGGFPPPAKSGAGLAQGRVGPRSALRPRR